MFEKRPYRIELVEIVPSKSDSRTGSNDSNRKQKKVKTIDLEQNFAPIVLNL